MVVSPPPGLPFDFMVFTNPIFTYIIAIGGAATVTWTVIRTFKSYIIKGLVERVKGDVKVYLESYNKKIDDIDDKVVKIKIDTDTTKAVYDARNTVYMERFDSVKRQNDEIISLITDVKRESKGIDEKISETKTSVKVLEGEVKVHLGNYKERLDSLDKRIGDFLHK